MRTRESVRLLILNSSGKILLMKFDDHRLTNPDGSRAAPFWATFGGGTELGEDVYAAARREAREETGRTDVRIGPPVWYRETTLVLKGEQTRFKETYLVAWLDSDDLTEDSWEDLERSVIKETRWWSLEDLIASAETIYPVGLAQLLPPIIAGRYPNPILILS